MSLRLELLGPPRLRRDGTPLRLPSRQALQLAAFLAAREDWVARDELLALFWPEEEERSARHNLSQLLYHSRRQAWAEGLEVERRRVRWLVPTDLRAFREAFGDGDWEAALGHYRGELLEGLVPDHDLRFQEWLEEEREELRAAWREAALRHARGLQAAGRFPEAARCLREILRRDPLAEDALQAYLRLAARGARRDRALRAYEAFRDALERELGVAPLEETQELAQALRRRDDRPEEAAATSTPTAPVPAPGPALRGAPAQATPFVGRDPELAELGALLQAPHARVVTLVGPGGVGKTRLALQAATELAAAFPDGAAFVPLASAARAEHAADAIAAALGLEPRSELPRLAQVAAHLRGRGLLLLLDNLEHLPAVGAVVDELLGAASGLRVLATSRQPLELPDEVLFEVGGLAVPEGPELPDADSYDAVALFARSARRVDRHFTLGPGNRAAVVELCRLLEGLPLGLELAAAWARLLTPAELLQELRGGLARLAAAAEDGGGAAGGRPARQRSLVAAFAHSWALLSDAERQALRRLAVFRSGFDKELARQVTGAELRTLLALVSKSLLRRTPDGRYERHAVVRELAEAELERDPAEAEATRRAHAEAFRDLARAAEGELRGPSAGAWLERLERAHDDLRAALDWAAERPDPTVAVETAAALARFWWLRGHHREGLERMEALLARLPEGGALRLRALLDAGNFARMCMDFGAARARYDEALAMAEASGGRADLASVLGKLAMLDRIEGDPGLALERLERALALDRELGREEGTAMTLLNLAAIAESLGDRAMAERRNQEGLELARRTGDAFVLAAALGNQARYELARAELDAAETHGREALARFEALGYGVGEAVARQHLGLVALRRSALGEAQRELLAALDRFREVEDQRGIAEVLLSGAELAARCGEPEAGGRLLAAALTLRERLGAAWMPDEAAAAEALEARLREDLGGREVARGAAAAAATPDEAAETLRALRPADLAPEARGRA